MPWTLGEACLGPVLKPRLLPALLLEEWKLLLAGLGGFSP